MRSVATDWQSFTPPDVTLPAGLLDGIAGHTADAWVTVEPEVEPHGGGVFRRKSASSPFSATVSPYTDDDEPHFLLYLSFPKGERFTTRCPTLPPGFALDDESKDDATLRTPLTTTAADTMQFVMQALASCSVEPLGAAWRAAVGDTTISRSY